MYTLHMRVYMAKLYWRIKKNGKWTWKPVKILDQFTKTLVSRLETQDGVMEDSE